MSAVLTPVRPKRPAEPDGLEPGGGAPGPGGDWPRTNRVLPWMIAGFLTMLWLVPFDSIQVPVNLPFDSKLDRVALLAMAVLWIAVTLAGGRAAPRLRFTGVHWALLAFVGVAVLSIIVNADTLANLGELELSIKQSGLLLTLTLFFFMVTSIVRPSEVRAFATFAIVLGCITALGTLLEKRTGTNIFFLVAQKTLAGPFVVGPEPANDLFGRPMINGPTLHGLAVSTMLAFLLPIPLSRLLMGGESRRNRRLLLLSVALMFAGAIATDRKSAIVVPVVALVILAVQRPRTTVRLLPWALAILLAMPIVSPGSLGSLRGQLLPSRVTNDPSTTGRTADYPAVVPDVISHPILGEGYGSYDWHTHRILDNQYLGLLIETGAVGVLALLVLFGAIAVVGRRAVTSRDASRAPPGLAATATAGAMVVATVLFDDFTYPQVPYVLLFVAALAVVVAPDRARRTTRA